MSIPLPVGCFVHMDKPDLQTLIDHLRSANYRVIGPKLDQSAVVLGEISSLKQFPIGWSEDQNAGKYRLKPTGNGNYFDFVVGPHSLKSYLFPPRCTVLEMKRNNGQWQMNEPEPASRPLAVLGLRSCDLHALAIQDQVFLNGPYVDKNYRARRAGLFILALNCGRSAPTCFCASMRTGPEVDLEADLVLTELPTHFVLEIGTNRGGEILSTLPWRPCSTAEVDEARQVPERAANQQTRQLEPNGVHDLLLKNLEHGRWDDVGERCLSCGNCTLVCPTCFCSAVVEVTDLQGESTRRDQLWDSCFNDEHSYMNSGSVHKSTRSRYRQWLTHKLATWHDQFGTSGCVGCGRCITWCPVGIDLTEEVEAIRGEKP